MNRVDGSYGEGGGQILRTSVSLAGLLGKDVTIYNIRKGRSEPGLKAQHLTGVKAAAEMCGGLLKGAEVGSTELLFQPSKLKTGRFHLAVGTAGSITLVLQTLMPLMAFAHGKVEVEVTGGTDVKWSPPVDYLLHVVTPVLSRIGYNGHLEIGRRGHYPRGGGLVRFSVNPADCFTPANGLDPGRVVAVQGVSHSVGLPRHVAERQSVAATNLLKEKGLPKPEIAVDWIEESSGLGPGSGLVLYAETEKGAILGGDSLGERGKPAERVGIEAAERLVEAVVSASFLDQHMGDMIVPYMTLAEGTSEVTVSKVTQHTLTNVKVAEWLAGVKFEVHGELGGRGTLRAKGLGLRNPFLVSPRGSPVSFGP